LAETLGYTLWSATTVGMFVWLMALCAAVVLSGADTLLARGAIGLARRTGRQPVAGRAIGPALAGAVALALAALAGGAGARAGQPDEHAFEFAALKTINARLGAVPRGHSVYLNARLDGLITPLRPELTYDLRRRGVRALGVGAARAGALRGRRTGGGLPERGSLGPDGHGCGPVGVYAGWLPRRGRIRAERLGPVRRRALGRWARRPGQRALAAGPPS